MTSHSHTHGWITGWGYWAQAQGLRGQNEQTIKRWKIITKRHNITSKRCNRQNVTTNKCIITKKRPNVTTKRCTVTTRTTRRHNLTVTFTCLLRDSLFHNRSYLIPQMPSRLSRLCVKFVQRWLRSPGRCWTVAMQTSSYGRPALRCSAALAAATPRACSVSLLSRTPDTCR